MINFDDVTKEDIKQHNPNWPQISDHSYRLLKIRGSGSGETNSLFNRINQQLDIDKIYLYAKDSYEAKHQLLINKRESKDLNYLMIQKLLLNSQMIWIISEYIEVYNPDRKRKILTVFNDIITDILSNKRLNPIVTELFSRERKLNISLVFTTQSYFPVPKNIRLYSMHYFIMKIPNKQNLQQIAFNH